MWTYRCLLRAVGFYRASWFETLQTETQPSTLAKVTFYALQWAVSLESVTWFTAICKLVCNVTRDATLILNSMKMNVKTHCVSQNVRVCVFSSTCHFRYIHSQLWWGRLLQETAVWQEQRGVLVCGPAWRELMGSRIHGNPNCGEHEHNTHTHRGQCSFCSYRA